LKLISAVNSPTGIRRQRPKPECDGRDKCGNPVFIERTQ
jgi:hypothetical protein